MKSKEYHLSYAKFFIEMKSEFTFYFHKYHTYMKMDKHYLTMKA